MDWSGIWVGVICATIAACVPSAVAGNSGDCCEPNGTPGCESAECEELVCMADGFCCEDEWDEICADSAFFLCEECNMGCPGLGGCYQANGTPGCGDFECCTAVCSFDPSCCAVTWDADCAASAFTICGNCGQSEAGNCCEANGTPGCDDTDCCESVCVIDPFCCNFNWDALCAADAQDICDVCDTGACCIDGSCSILPDTLCFALSGTYQGDGVPCGVFTCGLPVFGACCLPDWTCTSTSSSNCAALGGEFQGIFTSCAEAMCGVCGDPNAGDCFQSNGSPGCEIEECCQTVCSADGFCCTVTWDGACASAAANLCAPAEVPGACCLPVSGCDSLTNTECTAVGGDFQGEGTACSAACDPCPGDADGDGDTDSDDLNELLSDFGCVGSGCSGDLDGSGSVDSADLNILLGNFGCGV